MIPSEEEHDAITGAQDAAASAVARTVMRYVQHRISQHPHTEVTFEAECLGCDWTARPSTDGADVDLDCLNHTGRSGHASFRRVCTSFALVVRMN